MRAPLSAYIPQSTSDRGPLLTWSMVVACSLLLLAAIVGAPMALTQGHIALAQTIYATFSHLCHQLDERSFFVAGHKFAVCARCTGIYVGFAAAALCYPLLCSLRQTDTPPRKWLFIAAAPLALDVSLTVFGIWENTHLSRFLTGALLGAVAVFYIMPGLIDLSLRNWRSWFNRKQMPVH